MASKLDIILVVDVESTCWEGDPPAGQESEIIEIGLCLLDVGSLERLEKHALLIRPQRSTVSEFCTRLTTLTQAQVDTGISYKEACALLKRQYASQARVFASYGDYDRRQFERQCTAMGVGYPFGPTHLNIKSLFALSHGLSREAGLDRALGLAGLPLEGTHHRGVDDAWNIAGLLAHLLTAIRHSAPV